LSCVHDDQLGEFERYPNAKDMWDQLTIKFGQPYTYYKVVYLVVKVDAILY